MKAIWIILDRNRRGARPRRCRDRPGFGRHHDRAEQKGTGRWTVQNALDLGVPITGIAEATCSRAVGNSPNGRPGGPSFPRLPGNGAWPDRDEFVEDVRQALYASKVVAYQALTRSRPRAPNTAGTLTAAPWPGSGAAAASSGRFLNRITEAYERNPDLSVAACR